MLFQDFEHFMVEAIHGVERDCYVPSDVSKDVALLIQQGWDYFDGLPWSCGGAVVYMSLVSLGFANPPSSFFTNARFPRAVQTVGNYYKVDFENNKNDDVYISRLFEQAKSSLSSLCPIYR